MRGDAMNRLKIATLMFAVTIVMSALSGCGAPSDYYNINENVTITDARVSKLDSENAGRSSSYVIYFEKDGNATKFRVSSALYEDVEKILNTARMVNKEKELKFDVVTDGKDVVSVTLSSNRK
uniref:Lipoprotein n=1 Tax=Bacillus phage KoopaTroopa TaxID=3234046 RepID=A0AB39C7E8_9CAUD